ncbi:MAG: rod shape-determining protein RodA [Gammaproteobacteria bacterium]|nr:rod shape-determining protein RodA [Gammaproteobacteria bacterium]
MALGFPLLRRSPAGAPPRTIWQQLHLDPVLLLALLTLIGFGLVVLYSASGEHWEMVAGQAVRLSLGLGVMLVVAQIAPTTLQRYAIFFYVGGIIMLVLVLAVGDIGKGAQRWLDLGFMRFQPSEMLKLVLPITVAWYISRQPLPPTLLNTAAGLALLVVPTLLIAKQPDLGTSILIAASGLIVLFMAGMNWWLIIIFVGALGAFLPILWHFLMHEYQQRRVLMLLDPESDPLGAGYHIIQSKIAIGSGGWWGKGYLQGTQSQLDFLPERHTDFIFAVIAEELGYIGILALLTLYGLVIARGLYIAINASQPFAKLLAASITLTFFVYVFVNIGMVSGLLPVVGVPLPLVSFGGTSGVTLLTGFGMLMSIHTHRRFIE